jgi:hypothetical protein
MRALVTAIGIAFVVLLGGSAVIAAHGGAGGAVQNEPPYSPMNCYPGPDCAANET